MRGGRRGGTLRGMPDVLPIPATAQLVRRLRIPVLALAGAVALALALGGPGRAVAGAPECVAGADPAWALAAVLTLRAIAIRLAAPLGAHALVGLRRTTAVAGPHAPQPLAA